MPDAYRPSTEEIILVNPTMQGARIWCLLVCIGCCGWCDAENILLVPGMMRSHILEQLPVGQALLDKGHRVYIVLSTAAPISADTLSAGIVPLYYHTEDNGTLNEVMRRYLERGNMLGDPSPKLSVFCRSAIEDEHLRSQIREVQFHLAIVDCILLNFCNFLLPYAHGIRYVCMSNSVHPSYAGSPANPSFVPAIGLFNHYTDDMTFSERLANLFFTVVMLKFPFFKERYNRVLLEEYAPEVASWEELLEKSELFISTHDHHLAWPTPIMPNHIQVPGITYGPAKPLPKHLAQIANLGDLILVSFGSAVSDLPIPITETLLQVLNQFEEIIIWKLSGAAMEYARGKVSANVHLVEWLPQNDLLAHPNTKLFVTHCGNNGVYEAIYHAVPMVGLPIFGDQFSNSFRMQAHGYGRSLWPGHLLAFSSSDLATAMREVINNDTYKTTLGKSSAILKDSPQPADTISYWIEHILKHGSAHLRSHAMQMPWYQFWMVDILLFLVIVMYVFSCMVSRCLRCTCRKFRNKAKTD